MQQVSFSTNKVWGWLATAYLVGVPCLWWKGLSQDNAQMIAWHLGTFLLFGMSLLCESKRTLKSPAFGFALLLILASSLAHVRVNGYPMLPIHAFIGTLAVACLATKALDAEWISRRVRWLFWINVGYALMQLKGWDPLFKGTDTGLWQNPGLFSMTNQLTALLLVAVPFLGLPGRFLAAVLVVMYQSWTGIIGFLLWLGYREYQRSSFRIEVIVGWLALACVAGSLLVSPTMWAQNVAPRIETWKQVVGLSLWNPLVGFGDTARNFSTDHAVSYCTYSVPFGAFYAAGIFGLFAVLALAWWMFKSKPSAQKEAALLFAWACLFQNSLDFPRMILLGCALLAALEIKNQELNHES